MLYYVILHAFANMSLMKSVKWYIKIKNKWELEDYITVCTKKEKSYTDQDSNQNA